MKDYTYETLWNMHPDEFQALLMQFQKKAVMTPSPDNVYDYLTMQDIARKKSLAYANTVAYVNQAHPELTVKDEYPVAAPGRTAKTRLEQGEVDNTLKASSNDFAMLYFFSPDCQFCQAQSQILNFFTAKYPLWQIKRIDIQSQPGLATQFNVQTVPHIVLLYKHSDKAFPVATGVTSMVEMELSIYRAIRLIKGEITPQEWSTYEFQKGGSFDPIVKK
jgi:conjugal transfer pilus assembly protein TraF